ncbi:DUF1472 domain-containing protein [Salmonella enterica subsp. enterica serovar Napoli]|uniref:DUF1472 domain-containing protein n=1 Tax=Salmonella enterica subsp. salamae serovar 42:z:1,5 TaxID=1967617 RepID=A0A735Q211_SALER|nr:hypothetical protein [Salmonella enterica subsp. enterica serovar Napoli]ECB3569233.1 DUF1472 domain-containing protein [Salmonella enterica subsp. enterica serovar Napoli]HAE7083693.1 DUF1472 domain-containing protein [Salmonella enterica subsp. salamae serovar 42:z:1,5]
MTRCLPVVFRLNFRRQTVQPASAFSLRCGLRHRPCISPLFARLSYRHGVTGAAFEKGELPCPDLSRVIASISCPAFRIMLSISF